MKKCHSKCNRLYRYSIRLGVWCSTPRYIAGFAPRQHLRQRSPLYDRAKEPPTYKSYIGFTQRSPLYDRVKEPLILLRKAAPYIYTSHIGFAQRSPLCELLKNSGPTKELGTAAARAPLRKSYMGCVYIRGCFAGNAGLFAQRSCNTALHSPRSSPI